MLHLQNISKHYGSKTLFEDVEAHLGNGQKTALIGPNGSGKSTLIKLILGVEHVDHGEIVVPKNIKIGHLAQELPKFDDRTIIDEVMRLDGRREEILKQKADLEKLLVTHPTEDNLNAYSKTLEQFDSFDEYTLPSRAEQILEGVGFTKKDFHRNVPATHRVRPNCYL